MASTTGVTIGFKGRKSDISQLLAEMVRAGSHGELLECETAEYELPHGITADFADLGDDDDAHLVLCGLDCEDSIIGIMQMAPGLESFAEAHFFGGSMEESVLSELHYKPAGSSDVRVSIFLYGVYSPDDIFVFDEEHGIPEVDAKALFGEEVNPEDFGSSDEYRVVTADDLRKRFAEVFGENSILGRGADHLEKIISAPDGDVSEIQDAIDDAI